jgi:hypothetical protein
MSTLTSIVNTIRDLLLYFRVKKGVAPAGAQTALTFLRHLTTRTYKSCIVLHHQMMHCYYWLGTIFDVMREEGGARMQQKNLRVSSCRTMRVS